MDAAKGKFALTAASDGLHQLCFVNPGTHRAAVALRGDARVSVPLVRLVDLACNVQCACLTLHVHRPLRATCRVSPGPQPRNVEFSFKHGVDAKDYSNVAKKDHLEPLEVRACVCVGRL